MQWQCQINWGVVMKFSSRILGAVVKFALRFFAFIFGLFLIYFGYDLLMEGKLSGAEFVSIVVISIFSFFMVVLVFDIQEFSIGGAVLKLRDMKKDVDESVRQLERDRISMFKIFLRLSLNLSGGLADLNDPTDDRIDNFLLLVQKIESSGCLQDLKQDIIEPLKSIKEGQFKALGRYCCEESLDSDAEYLDLVSIVLSCDFVRSVASKKGLGEERVREDLKKSLNLIKEIIRIGDLLEAKN